MSVICPAYSRALVDLDHHLMFLHLVVLYNVKGRPEALFTLPRNAARDGLLGGGPLKFIYAGF